MKYRGAHAWRRSAWSPGAGLAPGAQAAAARNTKAPATVGELAQRKVEVHADGGVDILGYGFNEAFGPTQLIGQYSIAP